MVSSVKNSGEAVKLIRVIYKSVLFTVVLILFLFLNFLISLILRDTKTKLFFTTKVTTFLVNLSLKVFNVNVKVVDEQRYRKGKNFLAVSNHVSYIDVFSIASIMNSVFVASVDGIERDLLMGMAARLSGGIFVERKNRSRVREDMKAIKNVLDLGYNVVLFPEATTSNGDSVLPFKSSFFASAIYAKADIVPVCINYKDLNGGPITRDNRDNVYYYEELEFFPHFFNMLKQKTITIEIRYLKKIEFDPKKNRKELCDETYKEIVAEFKKL
ncbi:MAG: lysophospholipid acyltransferase family protein [Thermodesulfobacteriota bacterium]